MARPTLKQDAKTFLVTLRRSKSLGNMALRDTLGWSEERYWKVHSALIEDGKVEKGRGRGGSVHLA
jgi:hypothetical protein